MELTKLEKIIECLKCDGFKYKCTRYVARPEREECTNYGVYDDKLVKYLRILESRDIKT